MNQRNLANTLTLALLSVFFSLLPVSNAYATHKDFNYPHFYLGGSIAYGQTTWSELTSNDFVVEVSAPKTAVDFGTTWGGFMGYQFDQAFAVEGILQRQDIQEISVSVYHLFIFIKIDNDV